VTTVLVRLPNHVGDACMALPAIHALQGAGWPCALVGRAWGESLFSGLGLPYSVIEGRVFADRARMRELRRTKGDVCGLILPNSLGSALGFSLAGVASAGLATRGRRMLLRWPIQDPGPLHEVERFHAAAVGALRAWGSRVESPVPAALGLPVSGEQAGHALGALQAQGVHGAFALLAPIATGLHHGQVKHWAHFAALMPHLQQRGLQAVVAPPAQEADAVRAAMPGATLLRPVPLGTYAALAQRAAVVIANDSGSSHVAAAVGARQVTIFGVTDRKRTGPWSKRAVCVGDNGAWPDVAQVLSAIDQALAQP
jgi:heptosyltransferase II